MLIIKFPLANVWASRDGAVLLSVCVVLFLLPLKILVFCYVAAPAASEGLSYQLRYTCWNVGVEFAGCSVQHHMFQILSRRWPIYTMLKDIQIKECRFVFVTV